MTAEQLKSHIQASCSLTKGDVEATLSALREHMTRELIEGHRFYIPSIGYFSLAVDMDMPEDKPITRCVPTICLCATYASVPMPPC